MPRLLLDFTARPRGNASQDRMTQVTSPLLFGRSKTTAEHECDSIRTLARQEKGAGMIDNSLATILLHFSSIKMRAESHTLRVAIHEGE